MDKELKIELGLPLERLEDMFVGALEGGSNYWYWMDEDAVIAIRSLVPKSEDPCLSTAILKAVLRGAVVPVRDFEDHNNVLGHVSMETMPSRLIKCGKENPNLIMEVLNEEDDASTADAIFQYLTMGEIVFG
jgi:hypothetical protein